LPITGPVPFQQQYRLVYRQKVPPIAFLGRRVESWIPGELWTPMLLFFLSTLPDSPSENSPTLTLNASVRWNIPEGNKPVNFKVTAFATKADVPSTSTASLSFYVSVNAEKLHD
jgi:hypothetical protein